MFWSTMMRRKKLSLMVIVIVVVVQQLQLLFLVRWLFFSSSAVHSFPLTTPTFRPSQHRSLLHSAYVISKRSLLLTKYQGRSGLAPFSQRVPRKYQRRNGLRSADDFASDVYDKNQTSGANGLMDRSYDDDDVENDVLAGKKVKESRVKTLQNENALLRDMVRRLELENERLKDLPNRIVIETFEGEGKLLKQQKRRLEEIRKSNFDQYYPLEELHVLDGEAPKQLHVTTVTTTTTTVERQPTTSPPPPLTRKDAIQASSSSSSSSPALTPAVNDNDAELWCDELDGDTCPVEPTLSFGEALRDRAFWLVGLLVLQSLSGIILSRHETLLSQHPVIVYFLTMLVGAGGNAGNQASVRVIRGLALGTLNEKTQGQFLMREIKMATALSCILSLAGFVRAIAFRTPLPETLAVTSTLAMIVFTSVGLGAVLPILLQRFGVDPAHSSTTIQVIMDILGVILTVAVSSAILDSALGHYLLAALSVAA